MSSYVGALVDACVYFESFSDFSVNAGDVEVESTVSENVVEVSVVYPFEASAGDSSYTVDDSYESSVDANLGWLRDVAADIVAYDVENDDVNYDYILGLGVASVTIASFDDDTYLYLLEDSTSFGGEQNYTFLFAEYYSDLEVFPACEGDFACDEGFSCVDEACVEDEEDEGE